MCEIMTCKYFWLILAFATAPFLSELAYAEPHAGSWSPLQTLSSPPARLRHAFTYDSKQNVAVLFGGTVISNGSFAVLGDTWLWNSATKNWQGPLALISAPSPRYGSAMIYDSNRGVVVLFGGAGANNIALSDTWEFNGTTWKEVTPVNSPAARLFHALAYNSAQQQVVLFGGLSGSNLVQDTWTWNGSEWNQLTNGGPSSRELHSLSYDSLQDKVLLFGGFQGSSYLNDLWQLNGPTWVKNVTSGPEPRIESTFTYVPNLTKSIIFGGLTESGLPLGDTWLWNSTSWEQSQIVGPSPRLGAASTYDSQLSGVLLFGGADNSGNLFGDTWIFSNLDSDNDGVNEYSDLCPVDPLKSTLGICGCGTPDTNPACENNLPNIKPNRVVLKMNKQKLRVKMQSFSNVRYILSYYEKVSGGKKPKIITIKKNSSTLDISRLKQGHRYVFSYRLVNMKSPIVHSKISPALSYKVLYKR